MGHAPEAHDAAGRSLVGEPDDEDDIEAYAAQDVAHLGRALHQAAHAGGWDNLRDTDGLAPLDGTTAVVEQERPLDDDPDARLEQLGAAEDDLIHSQSDVSRG